MKIRKKRYIFKHFAKSESYFFANIYKSLLDSKWLPCLKYLEGGSMLASYIFLRVRLVVRQGIWHELPVPWVQAIREFR
jgi:hypothetical protein